MRLDFDDLLSDFLELPPFHEVHKRVESALSNLSARLEQSEFIRRIRGGEEGRNEDHEF